MLLIISGKDVSMTRIKINYVVDIVLMILIITMFVTGIIRFPEFLKIFGINYAQIAASLPIYQIRLVHDWSGVMLFIFVLVHLALNWRRMVNITKQIFGRIGGK